MKRAAAVPVALCLALLAGCGGSATTDATTTGSASTTPAATTLEALWRGPGPAVALVPGTSDYGPGRNRVSFLVVDKQSRLVERPTAQIWIARGLKQKPFATTTARLESIGVPGGVAAQAQHIYVTHVTTQTPGTYWLLAKPVGGRAIQALGNVKVLAKAVAPTAGDHAIAIDNPTATTVAAAKKVSTASPPDLALLGTTVRKALAAKQPFVVTFATPQFCQSRTCGPVVQVVQGVERRWRGKGLAFIHVEIYKDNDPAKGVNRWVDAWRLPTEPFTFVVDRTGVISTRLEGAFSTSELEAAVRAVAG